MTSESGISPKDAFLAELAGDNELVLAERMYIAPNIPEKILKNAISSYANDVSPNSVLFIADDSTTMNGSTGLMMTEKEFIAKIMLRKMKRIPLSNIREVKVVEAMFGVKVFVDAIELVKLFQSRKHHFGNFADFANKFITTMSASK